MAKSAVPQFVLTPLIAGVIAGPLAIGLVTPAGWATGVLVTALCLLGWSLAVLAGRARVAVSPRLVVVPASLYGLALLWAGLQLLPLGGLTHPLWSAAAETLDVPVPGAVSVSPHDTRDGLARLVSYAGVFWLALQAGRSGPIADRLMAVVAITVGAYTLYGLAINLPGTASLAVYARTVGGRFSGPLVNANNFATLAGIGLIAATAVLYEGVRTATRGVETAKERSRLKVEYVANRGWPYVITWVLGVSGLLLSQSRAGFLATMVALSVFFLVLALSQSRNRTNIWAAASLAAGAVAVFVVLSGGRLLDRLAPETVNAQSHGRSEVYTTTLTAIGDAPLEGYGLGSFREVFRLYQPADLPGIWAMAHNTYLENALELGVPAAAALTLAVAWLAARCLFGAFQRRNRRALPAAAFAVSVLLGLHSAVDFPLQIPAITAFFAVLLGAGVAQSWSRDEATGLADPAGQTASRL